MILSIITILPIIIYIFVFISNSFHNKKSRLDIKHISPINKNNHTRITNNKNCTGTIVNFEKSINDEKPFDDIMLTNHYIQEK